MDELIMTINVTTYEGYTVKGGRMNVYMVPFTAEANGKYFKGATEFRSYDTQREDESGFFLSARYILRGKDFNGRKCSIFIENNSAERGIIPTICTDSPDLAFLEYADLYSLLESEGNKVTVRIYAKK
ncbi:MAG: hypothetical protein J5582_12665 [Ruminococcus sp.]|uniref:hypothetical protein n=1 Tax=Ruminococcus sp. TaxID=41978 RepID=UPI0025E5FDC2|nr:hypothetical protein [Ruminococcus sp.]MBO4867390.1 hypothetical protein [Ruminococcus sp.]